MIRLLPLSGIEKQFMIDLYSYKQWLLATECIHLLKYSTQTQRQMHSTKLWWAVNICVLLVEMLLPLQSKCNKQYAVPILNATDQLFHMQWKVWAIFQAHASHLNHDYLVKKPISILPERILRKTEPNVKFKWWFQCERQKQLDAIQ